MKMLPNQDSTNENLFKDISEISSDWVWEIDTLGEYTYVSSEVETFLGYKDTEVLGKTPFDLMSVKEGKRVQAVFLQYTANQQAFKNIESVNIHKDGSKVALLTSGVPFFDKKGNFKGYRGINKDISREKKLISKLQNQNYILDQAQEIASIGHWSLNLQTNTLKWSDQVYRIFGLTPQEVDATYESFLHYIHPDDRELVNEAYTNSVKDGTSYRVEHRIVTAEGKEKYVEERCVHRFNKNGKVTGSIGTIHDMTSSKENDKELQLASKVFTHSNSAIIITDKDNNITTVNKAFEDMTGYTKEEVLGCNPKILGSGWPKEAFYTDMWAQILNYGMWHGQIRDKKKNGEVYHASQSIIAIKNEQGEIVNYIGVAEDITALINEQKEKEKVLTTSQISGLKNRYALLRDLEEKETVYAALLDINSFHQINNFYGYTISDKLLESLSLMMQSLCAESYEIYHLHADTFVITMTKDQNIKTFSQTIEHLLEVIESHTFTIEDFEIPISVTGVIASDKAKVLINTLDMCLKHARKNRLPFWIHDENSNLNYALQENLHWTKELKSAFKEDRVVVYFQPIYAFATQKIQRYESLVRVVDNDGNIFTPNYFLDVAESSNQMKKLTRTVFLKTLEMLRNCKEDYSFSINISFSDMQDWDFLEFIKENLQEYDIARRICFEILETEGIVDEESVLEFIQTVHKLGCQIAIDDFGSGYANFENLIKFDIDIIKIDGTLIEKIAAHQDAYDIVAAIVGFGKKRSIKIIAEFVKNRSIFDIVQSLGIDYAQGYYIDKPKAIISESVDTQVIGFNEPYKTIIYVSQVDKTFTYEDSLFILDKSWNKNRQNNIGGVLIYDKQFFVQLLNGPVDKVDRVFERISQDKRHHTIRIIGESVSNEIEFDEWNMGFLPKRDSISDIFKECGVKEGMGFYNASFDVMKNLLKKLTLYI